MYIAYADMGKATKVKEMGRRPVVVINSYGNKVDVLKITSRMRIGTHYAKMNNYMISGFCNAHEILTIDKKFLMKYLRECTVSEIDSIKNVMIKTNAIKI